eukprot:CAMPEP_0177246682 /NCGR_PEP_ID=MMETSP0367-20130122/51147_1 /TAXON_ID=447022 ORGANISM="Scrippsiella hangoei-like, Strain SHHI-4" /NCGR_SAMPLE_ID=MMETSP0367 /ASSEMBLY_ACC=CAM_ASM_000362 /LENGTH=318 /DNA_ID=CAMNT_0018698733 /DNA_START=17 /DNA_END=972 /DNA_ORIENTATION=+
MNLKCRATPIEMMRILVHLVEKGLEHWSQLLVLGVLPQSANLLDTILGGQVAKRYGGSILDKSSDVVLVAKNNHAATSIFTDCACVDVLERVLDRLLICVADSDHLLLGLLHVRGEHRGEDGGGGGEDRAVRVEALGAAEDFHIREKSIAPEFPGDALRVHHVVSRGRGWQLDDEADSLHNQMIVVTMIADERQPPLVAPQGHAHGVLLHADVCVASQVDNFCQVSPEWASRQSRAHAVAAVLPLNPCQDVGLVQLEDECLISDMTGQGGPVLDRLRVYQMRSLMVHVVARVAEDLDPRHHVLVVAAAAHDGRRRAAD